MSVTDIEIHNQSNPSIGSKAALGAIKFYRKHLSHRKGFNCASGVMGLQTCSTVGLEHFRNNGLWTAIQRQRESFRTCREMSEIYNLAVRNDHDEAVAIIREQYSKPEEEAERLVQMAVIDAEARNKLKEEIREELKDEMKRKSQKQPDCCIYEIGYCGSMRTAFGGSSRGFAADPCGPLNCGGDSIDIGRCEVVECNAGGCDVGPCN